MNSSEKLPPTQLVQLLNEYLTVCTDIIQEEGGTLDKYIGDAVVAMFGAPIALPDHAYRACVTALRVQHALDELRQRWVAQGEGEVVITDVVMPGMTGATGPFASGASAAFKLGYRL